MTEQDLIDEHFNRAFAVWLSSTGKEVRVPTINVAVPKPFLEPFKENEKGFNKEAVNWMLEYEFGEDLKCKSAKVLYSMFQ